MKWHIEQNKEGDECIITCDKGITFISATIVYNTYNQDKNAKAKTVNLFVPFNSWKKK